MNRKARLTVVVLIAVVAFLAWWIPHASSQVEADKIIPLSDWSYDDLYDGGISVEEMIDEMEVLDAEGKEVGDVEDVIFNSNGEVISIIAEVGGILDIGDTHVNVPWDQVGIETTAGWITLPLLEEELEHYGVIDQGYLTVQDAEGISAADVDDAVTGPRAWRASELIGDAARLHDNDTYVDYGYVNDMIIKDGELVAVIVDSGIPGKFAYPYYGWAYGWNPGMAAYDLPYIHEEVEVLEEFEEKRLTN